MGITEPPSGSFGELWLVMLLNSASLSLVNWSGVYISDKADLRVEILPLKSFQNLKRQR